MMSKWIPLEAEAPAIPVGIQIAVLPRLAADGFPEGILISLNNPYLQRF